jgi:hypothetical protein
MRRRSRLRSAWIATGYAHARALGVVRLGPGPNARMRFDLALVHERVAALAGIDQAAAPEPRSRPDVRGSRRSRA